MSVMAATCDQADGTDQTRLFAWFEQLVGGQAEPLVKLAFRCLDGEAADLVSGLRHVERDARHGRVTTITIEGNDKHGRALEVLGTRLSGVIINRHSVMDSINDHPGHGENQGVWAVQDWAAFRSQNAGAARA